MDFSFCKDSEDKSENKFSKVFTFIRFETKFFRRPF